MVLSVVDDINHGCPGRLKKATEAETSRLTSAVLRHEVFSPLW